MANILIIDDSALSRRILRRILESAGHSIHEADDGMIALEHYMLNQPDLVLLDMTMRGMHGLDVLGKLRAELRKVLESPDVKQKMNAAGGLDPYLTTPQEFSALIRRDYEKYAKVVKDIGIKLD